MKVVLLHLEGSKKGKEEALTAQRVRVGRDPSNDMVFDPYVDRDCSGFHAEFLVEEGSAWVKDVGSTNGTYVNGSKVDKKALNPLDEVSFGRKGPKLRVVEIQSAGGAPAAGKGPGKAEAAGGDELADRRPGANVGTKTMKLMVQQAMDKAREKGGMAGGTMFLREMVRQSVKETSGRQKWTFMAMGALLLVAAGIIGFQIWRFEEFKKQSQDALHQKDEQIEKSKGELLAALKESWKEKEDEYDDLRRAQLREQDEIVHKYEEELRKARNAAQGDRAKIARLERILSRIQSSESLFKQVQKKYDASIVIIYTEFKVKTEAGAEKLVAGFGTGFIVSRDGYVVTNKHVVQPWKFSHFAFRLKEEGQTLAEGDPLIAAWCAGKRVYEQKDGQLQLNLSTGYDTSKGRNLKLVETAPDNMCWVTRTERRGRAPRVRKVWAHEPADNNDVALLKISDPGKTFLPVPLMSDVDYAKLDKLDRVMVLGFPRGGSILERGIAETSPALGHIRKVERSIHISAPITQGNSGGPVFSQTGEAIGISTRMIKGVETYGLCIPISEARKLLPE